MNENCILKLDNITKSYQDGNEKYSVLHNAELNSKAGEFVMVVGPSGSGKSTLLSIAGMMLSPDSGKVFIGGKNMSGVKQSEWTKLRREHIGFIFQNHQLLPYLNAFDQLTLFQEKKNRSTVNAAALMEELGISDCKDKYPAQMSGGEKQRVAIARAFINNPELILADEPTASLDGARGRQVVEMIQKEVKKRSKAAVMVTHDERILSFADTIYRLEDGKIVKA